MTTSQLDISQLNASNSPASSAGTRIDSFAQAALKSSAQFWFLVAVAGQWIFAYYVVVFYGGSALRGDLAEWNKVLANGIISGDILGNIAVVSHMLLAAIITIGGPLQLIPQLRSRLPTFHHWNGRIYLFSAFLISIGGLYMVITRGTITGTIGDISVGFNAVLIIICAFMTVRYAIARNIQTHRRWALRLFLVVSGVWFFRVGLLLWVVLNNGPVGFDFETFQGPTLDILGFAQYLVPLAILEIYFRAQNASSSKKLAMSTSLVILTVAMGIGIFAATMGLWLPNV